MATTDTISSSAQLLDEAAQYIPGGVNASGRGAAGICFRRGDGAHLEDVDGNRYLDFHAGAGTVLLGHGDPAVARRVGAAMAEAGLFGAGVTEAEVELARRLVAHVPSAERVLVCTGGSEATAHAIRLARGATRRERIVKFQGCDHGGHDYVLRNVLSRSDKVGRRDPHSSGMLQAAIDATLVCPFNDLAHVQRTLSAYPGEIAAVIVEPVAHAAATILPAPGFLEGLRECCDREGAVLIFDEIATGVRHHLGGYQAIAGVTPDLTTLGQALGNGFPIAAVAGRRDLMEQYATHPRGTAHFAGTCNGNGPAVEAALATIERLEDGAVHERIFRLGERMRAGLREIAAEAGIAATVAGFGSVFCLCFMDGPLRSYDDAVRNDDGLFRRYRRELIARGVFELPERLAPSHVGAAHADEDVDRALQVAQDALRAALG